MTCHTQSIWWRLHVVVITIVDILLYVGLVFVSPTWTRCVWKGGNIWLAVYLVIVTCFLTLNIGDLAIGYIIVARTEAYGIVVEEAKQLVGALQVSEVSDCYRTPDAGPEIYIESIFNVPRSTNKNLRFFAYVLVVYNTVHLTYVNVLHATEYKSNDILKQIELWTAILLSLPSLIVATITVRWCKLAWMTWANTSTAYARLQ